MTVARSFRWRCRSCGAVFLVVGTLTDDALATLRDHFRQLHASAGLLRGCASWRRRRALQCGTVAMTRARDAVLDWLGWAMKAVAVLGLYVLVGWLLGAAGVRFLHALGEEGR